MSSCSCSERSSFYFIACRAFAAYEAKVLGELRNFRQQLGLCGTPGPAPIGSLAPIASGVTLVETVDASTAGPAATVMPEPPHRRRSSIKGNAPAAATRANSTSGATTVVSFPQLRPSKASAPISTLRSEYTDFLKRLYTKKYGGALPLSRDPSTKVFTTFSRSTLQPGVSRGMSTAMSRGFSSAKPPEMSETPSGAADNRD